MEKNILKFTELKKPKFSVGDVRLDWLMEIGALKFTKLWNPKFSVGDVVKLNWMFKHDVNNGIVIRVSENNVGLIEGITSWGAYYIRLVDGQTVYRNDQDGIELA